MDPLLHLLMRLDMQAMRGAARSEASCEDRAACKACLATGVLQQGDCNIACPACKGTGRHGRCGYEIQRAVEPVSGG